MQKSRNFLSDRSSKIKNIYLELNNYSFFHNPSEIGNVDRRFLGRKQIIARLKSLLTDNETKCGSYLVTSYRGMGKSSFVNRVLSEISCGYSKNRTLSRYLRIFIFTSLLALLYFDPNIWGPIPWLYFIILPICLFMIPSAVYLIKTDPYRTDLLPTRIPSISSIWIQRIIWTLKFSPNTILEWTQSFLRTFILEKETISERRLRAFISDFYLISFIHLLAGGSAILFKIDSFLTRYAYYLTVGILLCIFNHIWGCRSHRRIKTGGKNWKNKLIEVWKGIKIFFHFSIDRLRHFVNYSHRFYIHINLGHDNLREEDILRMIARNLGTSYQRVKSFIPYSFPYLIWKTLLLMVLYLVIGMFYHFTPINSVITSFRINISLETYLPSQSLLYYVPTTQSTPLNTSNLISPTLIPYGIKSSSQFNPPAGIQSLIVWYRDNRGKIENYENFQYPAIVVDRTDLFHLPTVYLDSFAFIIYQEIRMNTRRLASVLNLQFINNIFQYIGKKKSFAGDFQVFPLVPDYLFFFSLLLCWVGLRFWASRQRPFGWITHDYIYRQIRDLNERITAQITKEQLTEPKQEIPLLKFSFGWSRKKTSSYPIADVREIEKELIDILANIDKIPRIMARPQFYFIFDELDKIEPHQNVGIFEKEAEQGTAGFSGKEEGMLFQIEEIRERQYTILAILANLKHMLTTAKAKFIFIAGREMYDAALADVSDRHFFMGSIFNDVIYVPSFLTDPSDDRLADSTSMTETYVCQFLLPTNYPQSNCSLNEYNKYLKDNFFQINDPTLSKEEFQIMNSIRDQKIEKIIYTLQNFITYLTYRSNGAPKKITSYFEKYVIRSAKDDLLNKNDEYLVAGKNSGNLYLFFGFYSQYKFGLISYIANPFFYLVTKPMKDFGDKLLFSTAFIIDHIYKYHGVAFSWRNLELTPEILDIHKSPELRELINTIMNYLSNFHIEEIVSGLYDFKFMKKIVEEIDFLSKISEEESAAFNFTLDESLSVKRHYNNRLTRLKAEYEKGSTLKNYVHSIGFVHTILGDLYFYDEEYDDAITQYQEAVQYLRKCKFSGTDEDLYLFLLVIRDMLKLGFALEKKKSFDSAYMIYGKLTSMIIDFRNLDLRSIGLKEIFIEKNELAKQPNKLSAQENIILENLPPGKVSALSKIERTADGAMKKDEPMEEIENEEYCGEEKVLSLSRNFSNLLMNLPFTPKKEDLMFRLSLFEGIRLVYQSFLAKFQIMEKAKLGGIIESDLNTIKKEFDYLAKAINLSEHYIIFAEFQNKVGNILYYKNGLLPKSIVDKFPRILECYCGKVDSLCVPSEDVSVILANSRKTPCRACEYYMNSLRILCENYLKIDFSGNKDLKSAHLLLRILRIHKGHHEEGPYITKDTVSAKSLANTLSHLGDTFLSCISKYSILTVEFFKFYLDLASSDDDINKTELFTSYLTKHDKTSKIEEVFLFYYFSAIFYRDAGERKEYSLQMLKILYVIKDYVAWKDENKSILRQDFITRLGQTIVKNAISGLYRAYENLHRLEILKLNEVLELAEIPAYEHAYANLNWISISANLKEIILIYKEICLKKEDVFPANDDFFISPYGMVNSMYNRIIELRYKANWNYKIFKKLRFHEIDRNTGKAKMEYLLTGTDIPLSQFFPGISEPRQIMEFLIMDSLFCFHEILRICKIYGISYMVSHSLVGSAYFKCGCWCDYYYAYLKNSDDSARTRIQDGLTKLIGAADLITLSPSYHYEMALRHLRQAHETHSEGKAYRRMIEKIYYLNDDFNDNLNHFCIASERYRINTGRVKNMIVDLKEKLKMSKLYDIQSYCKPQQVVH